MDTVTLTEVASGISVTGVMGDMNPDVTGLGGITEIQRPLRKPLVTNASVDNLRQRFEFVIDGFPDRVIAGDVAALERLGNRDQTVASLTVIRIAGPGLRFTEREWVIENIEPGDEDLLERDDSDALLRQSFIVSLVEATVAQSALASGGTGPRTHRVKKGETGPNGLKVIAKRYLGSAKKWKKIAAYNSLRKPGGLKLGQVIRIPPK